MPQLMPFMWIFSWFVVVWLIVILCFLYDNILMNKYYWDKGGNDMIMMNNWKW